MDKSASSGSTVIDSVGEPPPIVISDGDMKGRDTELYAFITSIITLGRKIEMDDVE